MAVEHTFSLNPLHFFAVGLDCHFFSQGKGFPTDKKFLLPTLTALSNESPFGSVYMGWNEQGISFMVDVNQPYVLSRYPEVTKGDSIEFFIDTRDLKSSGFNTRFCHHFVFFPKEVEGHTAREMTHFRSEDSHPLCEPALLKSCAQFYLKSYQLQVFIPKECLVGYDPVEFQRLGFNYRINRTVGHSQHFSAHSKEFQIEQQPSLWASLQLVK